MECRAICGSLLGGGQRVLGLGKGLSQTAQLLNCKSSAKQILLVKKSLLQVRAVSTETSPAGLGRRARREENVDGDFYVGYSSPRSGTTSHEQQLTGHALIVIPAGGWPLLLGLLGSPAPAGGIVYARLNTLSTVFIAGQTLDIVQTVFSRKNEQSAVHHQPTSQDERLQALQALLACPTSSIRTVNPPKDIVEAHKSFPLPIDSALPGVYHCGYHSEQSYAATSYFIVRPEGNILIDSPRYSEPLARRLDDLGGVRYMFLTHKDDVADHKKWQARFNCERIIHKNEVTSSTVDIEVKLEGEGNWTLGSDIDLIYTPGHTEAHVALLLMEKRVLFSGDHFWANSDGLIEVDHEHNWYSVPQQVDSIEALIPYDFTWVLPGHGRRYQFQSVDEKNKAINECVSRERSLSRAERH